MPKTRTPRDLLLAALERRHLRGFRASPDAAWVLFPPAEEGGAVVEVIHIARLRRFRVVSSQEGGHSGARTTTLGNFRSSDAAAACVAEALSVDDSLHDGASAGYRNGAALN